MQLINMSNFLTNSQKSYNICKNINSFILQTRAMKLLLFEKSCHVLFATALIVSILIC